MAPKKKQPKRAVRTVSTGEIARARRQAAPPLIPQAANADAPVPMADQQTEAILWLEGYEPKGVSVSTWKKARPFVVDCGRVLIEEHGLTQQAMPRYVRALLRLAEHQLSTQSALDINTALDPYTLNQFGAAAKKSDAESVGTYRSHLRFVGERLNPTGAWERPIPVSRRSVATPYTPAELAQLSTQIRKNTPSRRRGGEALMALGLGAGLDGRWAAKVRETEVIRTTDGLAIRLPDRVVPVLDTYCEALEALLEQTPAGGLVVGGTAQGKNAASAIAARLDLGPTCPALNAGRLRATWIVDHLTRGTRLDVLAAAAGIHGAGSFTDLMEFIPPLNEDADEAQRLAATMLRGRR